MVKLDFSSFLVLAQIVIAPAMVAPPAQAQTNFPQVMPADTVYGAQFQSGPGVAIPFSVMAQRLFPLITVGGNSGPGSIKYADLFVTAPSVGAKIDEACASFAGANGLVVIPSTLGPGFGSSLVGIPNNCIIEDLRGNTGFDTYGNYTAGFLSGVLLNSVPNSTVAQGDSIQTLQVNSSPLFGGINQTGGPKSNYSAQYNTMSSRTQGQVAGLSVTAFHFSNGDTSGIDSQVQSWGRNNAGGDEGSEGFTVSVLQGDLIFTGTVTSVVGSTVNYGSAVFEYTRGEARPLIITTPAKIYSLGNITTVTGSPPTVTGDGSAGQNFTTLGSGPVSNLFMAIDNQTNGAFKLVVPIRSITDATHLVLDYVSEGVDSALPAPTLPSTYKIFKGGNVTQVFGTTGSLAVSPNTDFVAGDTFEQPLGYAHTIQAIHINVNQKIPFSSNSGGSVFVIGNGGTVPLNVVGGVTGPFTTGWQFGGVTGDVILATNNPAGALVKSASAIGNETINFLGAFTAAAQNTFFSYSRQSDTWFTTKPIEVPVSNVSGLSAFPCNANSRGARMAVTDANAPTFLGTLTGSSTTFTPVICDGSVWRAG